MRNIFALYILLGYFLKKNLEFLLRICNLRYRLLTKKYIKLKP